MLDRLLVIASDPSWLEAIETQFGGWLDDEATAGRVRPRVGYCRDEAGALEDLCKDPTRPVTVAIIFGFHAEAATSYEQAALGYGAREVCITLRRKTHTLPIVLMSPVRLDLLQRYAESMENVEVVFEESLEAIRGALRKMKKGSDEKQPWALVDMYVGVESVKVKVTLADGQVLTDMPVASDMLRFLNDTQKEFLPTRWELYKHSRNGERRLNDNYPDRLCDVGETLHQYLLSDPQRTAIETCLLRVGSMDNLHFRVVTDSHHFPDVPFEMLRDCARESFVREMSPLARTVLLRSFESMVAIDEDADTDELAPEDAHNWRVLVIVSKNEEGVLQVGQHRFHGKDRQGFDPLPDIDDELKSIVDACSCGDCEGPTLCTLMPQHDGLAEIAAAIGNGPWDVVHFCGHSVRADDNAVFLVLPGKEPFEVMGLPMNAFARILRKGHVKLLVLSSCEGASSQSLFKVAQEGVPAIIGFRWPVMSDESRLFSSCLHQKLASGASLGRAYLGAVRALIPDKPAFFSVMLVAQNDAWAAPTVNRRVAHV